MSFRAPFSTQYRAFSTSNALFARSTKNKLRSDHAGVPPYPYGPSQWFKQSNHGLYGGQRIQFGNNVSEKTETKSRRTWHPNTQYKNLFSLALNRRVRVRVTTRVLRTIDKVGGLDEYLLGEKSARIKELGMGGWLLRWRIMQTPAVKKRFAEQRKAFGLDEKPLSGRDGSEVSEEELQRDVESFDRELDEEEMRMAREDGEGSVQAEQAMRPGFMQEGVVTEEPRIRA